MVQPDYQQLVQDGFDNSLNYNNLRFFDYLNGIAWTGASVPDALQNAEARALADLKTADGLKGKLALTVNEPQVQTIASGKIALSFDVVSKIQPLPTRDQWDRVIQDFTAADPEVGAINLRVLQEPASEAAASSDCYYLPDNAVPTLSSNTVLPLDPLLSADPAFDRTDFINGVLPAVQRNGQTYALPLDLEPLILRYDPARFSAAQIPEPSNTWTVEDFAAALAALQPDSQGQAPFVDGESNGAYLLVLIASYGGLPLDYRTTPPTINFTDPTTVTAIQQVLDLARSGELRYSALGDFGATIPALPNNTTAVYSSPLDSRGRKIPRGATPDKAVFFPTGRQFNGVAYNLGAGYISTQSQNPEACYRFISTIAQHPELFSAMPVRRSLLASAALQAATAPDVLAMYQQVETLLSDPNTVAFPITGTGLSITDFLLQHWLFQAFDAYVLSDSDLDSALADAQTYASAFQTCAATLPPLSLGAVKGNDRSALVPYVDCAEHVDSSLKPVLDPLVSG
jgi:ABC-type glycerol-3-phosphate transport system substrate-binding protein